jgi:hypothetical protein
LKTKGSLRRISPDTRAQIYEAAIKDRKIPRGKLAEELAEKLGKASPSIDTLEKEISKARNHLPSDEEQPWSIGTCLKYGIPSDIIPVLIRLQEWVYSNEDLPFGTLSIRKAKWYALLFPVLAPMLKTTDVKPYEQLLKLVIVIEQYDQREQIAELMSKEYADTSDLDDSNFTKGILSTDVLLVNWANTQLESSRVRGIRHQWPKDADVAAFLQKVADGSIKI